MACANCDHTMQGVGETGGRHVFWCPRCGTLKMIGAVPEFESPTNDHLWPVKDIKAAPELLSACMICVSAIDDLVGTDVPTSTDWINIRAARRLACTAIAKAKAAMREPAVERT